MADKAVDLNDEGASRVRMQNSLAPLNLKEAMKGLESVLREKEAAIQQQEYELAAELRDREVKLRDRISKLESGWHRERGTDKPSVGEEEIAQIVSMWTGIPVMRIAQEESQRLLQMEDALHARVISAREIFSIASFCEMTRACSASSIWSSRCDSSWAIRMTGIPVHIETIWAISSSPTAG